MIYYEIIIRSAFDRENFFYEAYLDLNSFVSVLTVISKTAVNSKWRFFQKDRYCTRFIAYKKTSKNPGLKDLFYFLF